MLLGPRAFDPRDCPGRRRGCEPGRRGCRGPGVSHVHGDEGGPEDQLQDCHLLHAGRVQRQLEDKK